MIQGYHFDLTSVSENSILTFLKATQVSKAAGLHNLSCCFLKDGATFSFNSEKFPDLFKAAKLNLLYKKIPSLTQPCSYLISNIQRISSIQLPNIQCKYSIAN